MSFYEKSVQPWTVIIELRLDVWFLFFFEETNNERVKLWVKEVNYDLKWLRMKDLFLKNFNGQLIFEI